MYTIQNEFLKVNFQAKGAELTSIVNLKDKQNIYGKQTLIIGENMHLFYFQLLVG